MGLIWVKADGYQNDSILSKAGTGNYLTLVDIDKSMRHTCQSSGFQNKAAESEQPWSYCKELKLQSGV